MIDTQNGFHLNCTMCPKTGTACTAGVQLARQLAQAVSAAGDSLAEDFEMTGHGRLDGCCEGACGVVYRLCKRQFGVFCGVSEDTDPDALMAVAEGFLGAGPVRTDPMPRSMIFAQRQGERPEAAYAC